MGQNTFSTLAKLSKLPKAVIQSTDSRNQKLTSHSYYCRIIVRGSSTFHLWYKLGVESIGINRRWCRNEAKWIIGIVHHYCQLSSITFTMVARLQPPFLRLNKVEGGDGLVYRRHRLRPTSTSLPLLPPLPPPTFFNPHTSIFNLHLTIYNLHQPSLTPTSS